MLEHIANQSTEKRRDIDALTPLDARNSLLLIRPGTDEKTHYSLSSLDAHSEKRPLRSESPDRYYPDPPVMSRDDYASHGIHDVPPTNNGFPYRPLTPSNDATAPMYPSPPRRAPTLPDLEGGREQQYQRGYRW